MSIIYNYPDSSDPVLATDMLIGTSTKIVNGVRSNETRNFTLQQISDFTQGGTFIDPVATDFQIPVFNQGGLKITGSIMSQNTVPNGTTISITGSLIVSQNLTARGSASLGGNSLTDKIEFFSDTYLSSPVYDANGVVGASNQVLVSGGTGLMGWADYQAGLTFQGAWDALTNNPTLANGVGINGHFYIVSVAGNTPLDGNTDWQIGDWALFNKSVGQVGFWDKIDNTQSLTGSGTANTMTMWTSDSAIGNSLVSQAGTVVSVDGSLKVKDTVEATTANTNLKLKGAGTGGVEIMSADGITDGKIQLNCSQNSHGVTLQSPPHSDSATYTLILPANVGNANQVLTSAGAGAQLTWSTPATGTGTVTNFTVVSTAIPGITTSVADSTTTPELTLSITGTPGSGLFLDGTGQWSSPGSGVTDITATAPLNADVATGSVTLSMPAYSGGTNVGYVPTGGATGKYLDGAAGAWITLPTGDTYDLNVGTKVSTSVPLNLTSGSGTDNSVVNLTEGTGITLTQTSATEITIAGDTYDLGSGTSTVADSIELQLTSGSGADNSAITLTGGTGITVAQTGDVVTLTGVAQGVTGSGTAGKLPKFGTTTSLDDSIVTQGGGTTTITPLNEGGQIPASINFNMQTSSFTMVSYATRNTVTGPAPQAGDVFNFVLTSDLTWAVGGGVIPAGTYPFTITSVGSGSLQCNFNSYSTGSGATGTGYNNLVGNGSSTSVSSLSTLSIDGDLDMSTHQIKNVGELTATGTISFGSLKDTAEDITITKFVDEADGLANNDNDTTIPTSAAVIDYVTATPGVMSYKAIGLAIDYSSRVSDNGGVVEGTEQVMINTEKLILS